MLGNIKAAIKLTAILVWLAVGFVFLALAYKLQKWHLRDRIMRICSAGILRIIGIRVAPIGRLSDIRPLLLVSNHVSYLDIWILNAAAPVHFTPKIEISGWPVIKHICRMGGSIFVDRRAEKLIESKKNIVSALAKGNVICIFPEATTGNGMHILPFKSGFFSLAEESIDGQELTIQPVAVTYSSIRRLPIDNTQWPSIAWYGDMQLMPHLWNLLKIAPVDAELVFLTPVTLEQSGNRKKLASNCQQVIDEAIQSIRSRQRAIKPKTTHFNPRFLRVKK